MKISIAIIVVISLMGIVACNVSKSNNSNSDKTENKRVPLTTVDEAISYIETNFKNSEEILWIADSLNDNVGMNMVIIGDKLIKQVTYQMDSNKKKDIEFTNTRSYRCSKD